MAETSLMEMMETAAKQTEEVKKFEGDWRTQFDQLKAIMKQVTGWQEIIFAHFGKPSYYNWTTHKTIQLSAGQVLAFEYHAASTQEYGATNTSPGPITVDGVVYPPGAVVSRRITTPARTNFPSGIEFEGATLLQGMHTAFSSQEAIVIYQVKLKTDERYFLKSQLPETLVIQPQDPDYTLYDVTLHIPRADLAKESLIQLSNMINNGADKAKATKQPEAAKDPLSRSIAWLRR